LINKHEYMSTFLTCGALIVNMSYTDDLPRACMWVSSRSVGTSLENQKAIRERHDSLQADDVSD